MSKRKAYIDGAKFLGILLVLMNHIGLTLPFVNFYGGMFYVPVFFVTAGLTYYEKEEGLRSFARKKAKRLLVPYFVCNGFLYLFFAGKAFLSGGAFPKELLTALGGIFYSRNSLYMPGMEPNVYFMTLLNAPTWFLTALFLTYLLVKVSFLLTKERHGYLAVCLIFMLGTGVLLHYVCPVLLPWSIECVPLFYCYVICGYYIREKGLLDKKMPLTHTLLAIFFFVFTYVNGSANVSVGDFGRCVSVAMYNGIVSSFFVLWLLKRVEDNVSKKVVALMAVPGRHTMIILCFHMFVFALLQAALTAVFPSVFDGQGALQTVAKVLVIVLTIAIILLAEKVLKLVKERSRS